VLILARLKAKLCLCLIKHGALTAYMGGQIRLSRRSPAELMEFISIEMRYDAGDICPTYCRNGYNIFIDKNEIQHLETLDLFSNFFVDLCEKSQRGFNLPHSQHGY
jgi:hypothetical protein